MALPQLRYRHPVPNFRVTPHCGPASLDKGERQLVEDLKAFHETIKHIENASAMRGDSARDASGDSRPRLACCQLTTQWHSTALPRLDFRVGK